MSKCLLKVEEWDGGDKRSHATCSWVAIGKDIKLHAVEDENESEVRLVEFDGKKYAMEDFMVKWFEGAVFDPKVAEAVKKRFYDLRDHMGIEDTPASEPINCRYSPRAYEHWASEVDGFEKEVPEFDRSFFGL